MAFIRTVKEISISKETKRNESIGMKLMLLAKSYVYVKRTIKDKTMELVILSTMDILKQSVFGRMDRKLVYGTNLRVIKWKYLNMAKVFIMVDTKRYQILNISLQVRKSIFIYLYRI